MSVLPQLDSMCRLCLTENAGCINIFERDKCGMSLPVRIMACAALEVHAQDNLPSKICQQCRHHLEIGYLLRKRAQAANSKLRRHLRLLAADKKSRIFDKHRDDDEDDDIELEFEQSLQLIKDYEEQLARNKQQEWQAAKETELRAQLKNELRQSEEFCEELKQQLREEMHGILEIECMEKAQNELKAQLAEESRQQSMQQLLAELQEFLNNKTEQQPTTLLHNIDQTMSSVEQQNVKRAADAYDTATADTAIKRSLAADAAAAVDVPQQRYDILNKVSNGSNNKVINNNNSNSDENYYIVGTLDMNHLVDELSNSLDATATVATTAATAVAETSHATLQVQVDNFKITASNAYKDEDDAVMIHDDDATAYEIRAVSNISYKEQHNSPGSESTEMDGELLVFNVEQITKHDNDDDDQDVVDDDENEELLKIDATKKPRLLELNKDIIKTFKCNDCSSAFSTENALTRHLRVHQREDKNGRCYECHHCHIQFSCNSALKRHSLLHSGERPYQCSICGKSFAQREILKRHLTIHTGERPYKCTQCELSFTQKVCLTQHINKKHSKNPVIEQYRCHLCSKCFSHASGLSRHLASHTGLMYQCRGCERKFADRSSIKRHVQNVHNVEFDEDITLENYVQREVLME